MAFTKTGKAEITGVLDKELDKTAALDDKEKKKDEFVQMEKPIKPKNTNSER